MWCSKCGNVISKGATVCVTCGTPVPGAEEQVDNSPIPATSDTTPQAQAEPQAQTQDLTQAQPQVQEEPQVQSQAQGQTQTQAQQQADAQPQAAVQPQAQVQVQPQTQMQPQVQAQTQQNATYAQAQPQQNAAYGQAQPQPQPQPSTTYIYNTPQTVYNAQPMYPRENSGGLLMAAFIFNLISTICLGFLIIPLAWCIPMTVVSYGIYKGKRPNTVAFGVCTLIFVSLIGGILMLVADKDD